ncbi:MAG TPA: MoaD/ThiS family protein [Dehalococcoidia bacterium]|nr:MoaD/ThiS family protein [Dehalococcoidia bacterium]
MVTVRLPASLQPLAGGAASVESDGATLRALIDDLERRFPDLGERLLEAGAIRGDVMIAVGADETRELDAPLPDGAEVHILPAIAGG